MTKYILHGGGTKIKNEANRKFFAEIGSSLEDGDVLLLCYFAPSVQSNYTEEEKFEMGLEKFESYIKNKKIKYVLAKRKNFIQQLKEADAIYIHGGETEKLFETLKKYPEFLAEVKKKKLVVGSSAGAYVLAKYYVSDSNWNKEAAAMLGILPIKISCHFQEKFRKRVENKFKKIDPRNKLRTILIPECEMEIIEN